MLRVSWARARARLGLLAAIAATVAVLVVALAIVLGSLTAALREVVVQTVAAAPEDDRHAVLRIPAADDADAQADGVATLLAARFGDALIVATPPPDGGTLLWELTVDPEAFDPWSTPVLAAALHDLDREVRRVDGLAPSGASVDGGLAGTLEEAARTVTAVAAIAPVPLALIVLAGVIAVLQAARLLGDARTVEAALLRARGLAPATAMLGSIVELAVTVAAGALVGWAGGTAVAALATGAGLTAVRATWPIPLLAVALLGPLAGVAARRAEDAAGRTHRERFRATAVAAVLVAVAAAVFVWQLRGLGAAGTDAAAASGVWAFAVTAAAPALALAAAGLAVLVLFPVVAALAERIAAARPGLAPSFAARAIARRPTSFGVVVALVALSAAGAVLGGASIATWTSAAASTAALVAGGDARVDAARIAPADVSAVASADGVSAATTVAVHDARAGDEPVTLVAVPGAAAAVFAPDVPPAAESGVVLPASATDVTAVWDLVATGQEFSFDPETGEGVLVPATPPGAESLTAQALVIDALGTPATVALRLESTATGTSTARLTARGTLPEGAAPWTLVGVRVGYENSPGGDELAVTPVSLDAGVDVAWPSTAPVVLDDSRPAVTATFAEGDLAPAASVTSVFAAALGLETGDEIRVGLAGSRRGATVEVAGIVEAVPGTADAQAVLVPLDRLAATLFADGFALTPTSAWADGAGATGALAATFPRATVITATDDDGPAGALAAVWWVTIGAVAVLAAVAVVAAALAQARARATEVFVLRALGVTVRAQSRRRVAELSAVAAAAGLAGGLLGALVAWLVVPALTLAAVPGVAPVFAAELSLSGWPLAACAAILAVAVLAAALSLGPLLRGQARAGRVREAG